MNETRQIFAAHPIAADMFDFMCGSYIGNGMSRSVFEYKLAKGCVVKIEEPGFNQNALEMEVWRNVQFTDMAKWFAPCLKISPCGRILIQSRAKEVPYGGLPKKVPSFFTDLKPSNWGIYKGHPVAVDYAINLLMQSGLTRKLKKADW